MSLLSHDDVIFIQVRWYHGLFFTCQFFSIVPKHIKWPFLTKRVIHELLEEVMNFSHFTTFDFDIPPEIFEPSDDWENEYEKLLQVCALCFSVFWMNVFSLSLVECYFQLNQLLLDGLTWTKYRVERAGNDYLWVAQHNLFTHKELSEV